MVLALVAVETPALAAESVRVSAVHRGQAGPGLGAAPQRHREHRRGRDAVRDPGRPLERAGARAALLRRGDPVPARRLGHRRRSSSTTCGGQGLRTATRGAPTRSSTCPTRSTSRQNYIERPALPARAARAGPPALQGGARRATWRSPPAERFGGHRRLHRAGPRRPAASCRRSSVRLREVALPEARTCRPRSAGAAPPRPSSRSPPRATASACRASTSSPCSACRRRTTPGPWSASPRCTRPSPPTSASSASSSWATSASRGSCSRPGTCREAIDQYQADQPGVAQLPRGALRDGVGQGPGRGLGRRAERDRHPAAGGAGLAAGPRGADPPGAPAAQAPAVQGGHRDLQRRHQHLRAGARRDRPDARRAEGPGRLLRQPARPEREDAGRQHAPAPAGAEVGQRPGGRGAGACASSARSRAGRRASPRAGAIADRILKALDERGAEAFPSLQEGYHPRRGGGQRAHLAPRPRSTPPRSRRWTRCSPTTSGWSWGASRRASPPAGPGSAPCPPPPPRSAPARTGMQGRMDAMDREAFRLGTELQSMRAMLVATQKWVADTRASAATVRRTRSSSPSGFCRSSAR